MPQTIPTAQAATSLAATRRRQQDEAEATYFDLMAKESLTPEQAEALAAAVAVLNLPGAIIAEHAQAAARARHLCQIIEKSGRPETARSLEEARLAVAEHDQEVARYIEQKKQERAVLAEKQQELEGLSFSFNGAMHELEHLKAHYPFIRGIAPVEE